MENKEKATAEISEVKEETVPVTEEVQNSDTDLSSQILSNVDEFKDELKETDKKAIEAVKTEKKGGKFFKAYKIKDIVFLAIMAACILVTGSIMPIVGQIPLFGIVQLCLGLQYSIFTAIGLFKVRKPGSLMFISIFMSVVLVFMSPVMFFMTIICGIVAEAISLAIFHSYEKNAAVITASALFMPLNLPINYAYTFIMYSINGEMNETIQLVTGTNPWVIVGMSVAVIAVSIIGSLLGYLISKEIKKAGAMKK